MCKKITQKCSENPKKAKAKGSKNFYARWSRTTRLSASSVVAQRLNHYTILSGPVFGIISGVTKKATKIANISKTKTRIKNL